MSRSCNLTEDIKICNRETETGPRCIERRQRVQILGSERPCDLDGDIDLLFNVTA